MVKFSLTCANILVSTSNHSQQFILVSFLSLSLAHLLQDLPTLCHPPGCGNEAPVLLAKDNDTSMPQENLHQKRLFTLFRIKLSDVSGPNTRSPQPKKRSDESPKDLALKMVAEAIKFHFKKMVSSWLHMFLWVTGYSIIRCSHPSDPSDSLRSQPNPFHRLKDGNLGGSWWRWPWHAMAMVSESGRN